MTASLEIIGAIDNLNDSVVEHGRRAGVKTIGNLEASTAVQS